MQALYVYKCIHDVNKRIMIFRVEDYVLIYSGKNKNERETSGVDLLIQQKFEANIKDSIHQRQIDANYNQKESATHIVAIYAPDTNKRNRRKMISIMICNTFSTKY